MVHLAIVPACFGHINHSMNQKFSEEVKTRTETKMIERKQQQ